MLLKLDSTTFDNYKDRFSRNGDKNISFQQTYSRRKKSHILSQILPKWGTYLFGGKLSNTAKEES